MFSVKVKMRNEKPLISWMKPDVSYRVLNVYKYLKTDKETGLSTFNTWFLIGDKETGIMSWVDTRGLDYCEV